MKLRILFFLLAVTVSLAATTAYADSIRGRLGVTGRLGFIVPADNDVYPYHNNTDTGFVGGGGLIYGIDDHLAGDFEITRSSFGSEDGDFGITDFAIGGQYRFQPRAKLVPYVGAGLDVLVNDFSPNFPAYADVDTTVGVHLAGGVDYFITRQVALTAEGRFLIAPDADIHSGGYKVGSFDPTNFSATAGIRFFFK